WADPFRPMSAAARLAPTGASLLLPVEPTTQRVVSLGAESVQHVRHQDVVVLPSEELVLTTVCGVENDPLRPPGFRATMRIRLRGHREGDLRLLASSLLDSRLAHIRNVGRGGGAHRTFTQTRFSARSLTRRRKQSQ